MADPYVMPQTAAEFQAIMDAALLVANEGGAITQSLAEVQESLNNAVLATGGGGALTQTIAEIQAILDNVGGVTIVDNYLKANQNCNVPSGTSALPTSTATDYTAGEVFAYNFEAITDIVGMTKNGGTLDGVSGTYRRKYAGNFSSAFGAVQLSDGSNSQTGITVTYDAASNETWVDIELGVAPPHDIVVLAPAQGKVAAINDSDSFHSAEPELLSMRVKNELRSTSVRAAGVEYVNTDPVERIVAIKSIATVNGGSFKLYIDGNEEVAYALGGTDTKRFGIFAIIPSGSTYEMQTVSFSIDTWYETGVSTNG